MNNIQTLLISVNIISKKYEDIARTTGENFNIFSIMSMETNEVYTHSAFIAELLNPNGSHGQGSIFLKLFLKEMKDIKNFDDFHFENAKIIVEEYIGFINEDYTKGGFIDIVIKDNKSEIVIENKIYAGDQTNQLVRYKNHYKDCTLLYLTLDGSLPSDNSKGNLKLNECFHCISYSELILNWLEKCITEIFENSILKEAIKQYEHLIKKLTKQTTSDKMKEDLVDLFLQSKENIKGAFEIESSIMALKYRLCGDFFKKLEDKTDGNNKKRNKKPLGDPQSGVWFYNNESDEVGILIYFNYQFDGPIICITKRAENFNSDYGILNQEKYANINNLLKNGSSSEYWPLEKDVDGWEHTSWEDLSDGELIDNLSELINTILVELKEM